MTSSRILMSWVFAFALLVRMAVPSLSTAQVSTPDGAPTAEQPDAPTRLDVEPSADDRQIRERLKDVLDATGWFTAMEVRVENGVVFLDGQTKREELKKWAGDLARNTQDVAAVVNRLSVSEPLAWDFTPAKEGMRTLWHDFIRSLPFLLFASMILVLSSGIAWLTTRSSGRFLQERVHAKLLRIVLSRAAGAFVFLAGMYVVLRVAGLTQLALTVIGGTGLLGLAVGIAFRDITENFLASIFLSIHRPFETGDLVEVVGVTGYIQQLNVRTTVVMNLDGNLVQVPNSTVYKNTLRNFTVNPKRRETLVVGIGYDDAIDKAQEVVREVLAQHPAVLDDPEPWVLADSFGAATVQLRIYFWLNGQEHSWLKVRSSVIRLVKIAFQQNGISMPDEAREVVFPRGVPVRMLDSGDAGALERERIAPQDGTDAGDGRKIVSTKAEAGLSSEADVLEKQGRDAQPAGENENLLSAAGAGRRS